MAELDRSSRMSALNATPAPGAPPAAPPPPEEDAGSMTCPNCGCPLTLEKDEAAYPAEAAAPEAAPAGAPPFGK